MTPNQAAAAKSAINASICAYQIYPRGWINDPFGPPTPPVLRTIQGPGDRYFYNVVPAYQDAVGFVDSAANGYAPLFVSTGKDEINAALVGALTNGKLLVALRGTIPPTFDNNDIFAWMADWMNDGDIPPAHWWVKKLPVPRDCRAETGFVDAMRSLWPSIAQMIKATLAAHRCTGVVVTGHSKGAAMSFLAAQLIEAAFPQFDDAIEVHAFAPPPVGNKVFQTFYGGLGATTHRYQVQNDVVPFLPLWAEADFFPAISFPELWEELAWAGLVFGIADDTSGGYYAVGDFTYFDSNHQLVPGAEVLTSAMPAVIAALKAEQFATVAAAHSAVGSYLPCFR